MPLPTPHARREIHHRAIDMKAYARDDGLYDIEARLVDRKPFEFKRVSAPDPIPPGDPLHDLSIRVTVDEQYVVRAIVASSDVTPFGLCKQAEGTLAVLVGDRIAKGWSSIVKQKLRGTASCTHLMEMLIPLATVALQGIRGVHRERNYEPGPTAKPAMLDTCYAYDSHREVVATYWPVHFHPAEPEPTMPADPPQ